MDQKTEILNSWFSLVTQIQREKPLLKPFKLAKKLTEWVYSVNQKYQDDGLNKLTEIYISHYSVLKESDYAFNELWYDLHELIDYDIIKPYPKSINRVFEIVNLVLNEIFTFKTIIECLHCCNENRAC